MPTVKIPGIGPVEKKYVYAGVAVVAGIVGYAYWQARQAPADSGVSAQADDSTGLEGDAGDVGPGASDYVNPGGSQGSPIEVDNNPLPTSNAEWTRLALDYLTSNGYDFMTVSVALGKYLAHQSVTAAEADIIRTANAVLGAPPSGTYTITITPSTTAPPTGGTGGSTTNTALPKAPTGLKTWGNGPSRLTVPLQWNKVTNAVGYRVYRNGVSENVGHSVDTKITVGGLQPNTTYKFHVRAMNASGKTGPASGVLTVKTKK